MQEVTLPKKHRPYILFESRKPSGRKPSAAQQRILEQMRPGVWYKPEHWGEDGKCKDRIESCEALVALGRCITARIAKKGPDGKLLEMFGDELLLDQIMRGPLDQPLIMYRLASEPDAMPCPNCGATMGKVREDNWYCSACEKHVTFAG